MELTRRLGGSQASSRAARADSDAPNRYDPSSMRRSRARSVDAHEPAPFHAPSRTARALLALAVAAVAFALHVRTFDARSDGVVLGNDVLDYADRMLALPGAFLANAHHLGVHALDALVFQLLRAGGAAADFATAWRAEQLVACAGAAWAVFAIVDFAAELVGLARGALLGAVFSVAAGNWLYAASGETYLPGTAACVALVVLALRIRLGLRDEAWRGAAALLALACALRQDSVLVVPVLFVLLPWRDAAKASAAAGAVCLAGYALVWSTAVEHESFGAWLRGLADTGAWGRAPGLAQLGQTLGLSLAALAWVTWESLALGLGVLALALLPLVPPRELVGGFGRALLGLLAWFALRVAFFAWWQPSNLEYQTGNLAPFVLALALLLRPQGRVPLARITTSGWAQVRALFVLGIAVVLLAATNSARLITPNRGDAIARRLELAVALAAPAAGSAAMSAESSVSGARGLVLALDPLTGKALLRSRDARVDVLDASYAAGVATTASSPERVAVLERVRQVLAAGGGVVAIVDRVLPARMGWAETQLDLGFLAALEALGDGQRLKDRDGAVFGLSLRAR